MTNLNGDPIQQAVDKVEAPVKMLTIDIAFNDGRMGWLRLPADLTDTELLNFLALTATQVRATLAQMQAIEHQKEHPIQVVPFMPPGLKRA